MVKGHEEMMGDLASGREHLNMPTIVGLSLAQLQCAVGELWRSDKKLEAVEVSKDEEATTSTALETQKEALKVFRRIAVKFSQALQLWMFHTMGELSANVAKVNDVVNAVAKKVGATVSST